MQFRWLALFSLLVIAASAQRQPIGRESNDDEDELELEVQRHIPPGYELVQYFYEDDDDDDDNDGIHSNKLIPGTEDDTDEEDPDKYEHNL